MKENTQTITEVLNIQTGEILNAAEYLNQLSYIVGKERRALEEYIQKGKKYLVCPICLQSLKIRSIQGQYATHFAHLQDSDDCPIKTDLGYTREEIQNLKYNNVKESERHKYIKNCIVDSLSCDSTFSDIQTELYIGDKDDRKKRRRPDVSAKAAGHTFVFEIQLWTTFLSVIVGRDQHYQKNQIFIGWILDQFDPDKITSLGQDMLSGDNNNVFVVNDDTRQRSQEEHRFFLRCYYQEPYLKDNKIELIWKTQEVCFHELQFDDQRYKFHFFDFERAYNTLQQALQAERQTQNNVLYTQLQETKIQEYRQESLSIVPSRIETNRSSNAENIIKKTTSNSNQIQILDNEIAEKEAEIQKLHCDIMNIPERMRNNHPLGCQWMKLLAEKYRMENERERLRNK